MNFVKKISIRQPTDSIFYAKNLASAPGGLKRCLSRNLRFSLFYRMQLPQAPDWKRAASLLNIIWL